MSRMFGLAERDLVIGMASSHLKSLQHFPLGNFVSIMLNYIFCLFSVSSLSIWVKKETLSCWISKTLKIMEQQQFQEYY